MAKIPLVTTTRDRVRFESSIRRGKRIARSLESSGRPLRIDLGGGDSGRPGWINIDVTPASDVFWDLRRGIPFSDGRADAIYSSHLFEHIPFQGGQALMKDALRVLRPGGYFSICVPNAAMYIRAYAEGRTLPDEYFTWTPAVNGTSAIDAVNYVAYMGGAHCYMFDQENLIRRLELAGFVDVAARGFDSSIDLPEREFESIYAVGYKAER